MPSWSSTSPTGKRGCCRRTSHRCASCGSRGRPWLKMNSQQKLRPARRSRNLRSMALKEGDNAPDFEIQDDTGNPVKLSSFHGKDVVLFFYPKADTPGCTKEACNFRDRISEFSKHNA